MGGGIDKKQVIQKCNKWLRFPYGLIGLEWAYWPIKRKIIIEELLQNKDGEPLKDYKFFCFNGKVKFLYVSYREGSDTSLSFFDCNYNPLPVKREFKIMSNIEKPKNYESMLKLAEKLGKGFDFIRVDLYSVNNKIYFSELTNYPTGGRGRLYPESFDFKFGKYWKIKPNYYQV